MRIGGSSVTDLTTLLSRAKRAQEQARNNPVTQVVSGPPRPDTGASVSGPAVMQVGESGKGSGLGTDNLGEI